MTRISKRTACGAWLSTVLFAAAALFATETLLATEGWFVTKAMAQAPTDAQRAAIKSQCRSDYMAHCSSVPPGGAASLQCLEKNMSSLSGGCADAVRAVQAPATPKAEATPPKPESGPRPESEPKSETPPAAASTESAPPAAAPSAAQVEPAPAKPAAAATSKPASAAASKAAGSSTAKKPTQAQISAIRSACRGDYPNVCAGVPPGGAAALQCLARNQAKLSAPCGKAVAAVSGAGTSATAATTPAAGGAAAPAAAMVLRPMRPREELMVLRSACGADVRSLCGGVAPGGGRIAQCLAGNAASLSPACKQVLSQFAAR